MVNDICKMNCPVSYLWLFFIFLDALPETAEPEPPISDLPQHER